MGRQWLDPNHLSVDSRSKADEIDLIFPIFTTLQVRSTHPVNKILVNLVCVIRSVPFVFIISIFCEMGL